TQSQHEKSSGPWRVRIVYEMICREFESVRRSILRKSLRSPAEDFFVLFVCVQSRRSRHALNEFQEFLGAQYAASGGQAVGDGAGDHGGAAAAHQAHAGLRIDDVRVTLAGDLHILPGIAGGGYRGIGEPDELFRRIIWIFQTCDADLPALL